MKINKDPKTQHAVTLLLTVRRGTLHHYISPCTIQKVSCMYISVYTICSHRFIHIIYHIYIFLHIYIHTYMYTQGNCVSIPQTCLSFPGAFTHGPRWSYRLPLAASPFASQQAEWYPAISSHGAVSKEELSFWHRDRIHTFFNTPPPPPKKKKKN